MSHSNRKPAEEIHRLLEYIDCALAHPQPLPRGGHVFRSDLSTVPEVRDLYDCIYKLYTEESASAPFREPVNALEQGVFSYYETVLEPMSLRTVLDRIAEGGHYSQAEQVLRDVQTIWSNGVQFNGANSFIAQEAKKCQAALAQLRERIADEQQLPAEELEELVRALENSGDSVLDAIAQYFRKEEPSIMLSDGDLDVALLKVKHARVMRSLIENPTKGGGW